MGRKMGREWWPGGTERQQRLRDKGEKKMREGEVVRP